MISTFSLIESLVVLAMNEMIAHAEVMADRTARAPALASVAEVI